VDRNSGSSSPALSFSTAPNSSASALLSSSHSLRSHPDTSLPASSSAGTSLPTSVVERKSSTAWLHLPSARRSQTNQRGAWCGALPLLRPIWPACDAPPPLPAYLAHVKWKESSDWAYERIKNRRYDIRNRDVQPHRPDPCVSAAPKTIATRETILPAENQPCPDGGMPRVDGKPYQR